MFDSVRDELNARIKLLRLQNKLIEAQRIEQRTQFDLEMIREIGYCNGIENYSRYLSGRNPGEPPPCLFDYLPPDALVVLDESHVTVVERAGQAEAVFDQRFLARTVALVHRADLDRKSTRLNSSP